MRRISLLFLLACASVFLAGCPKGNQDYKVGVRAEEAGDYDTAVVHFDRALKTDPLNAEYKLHDLRARFEAGEFHVKEGQEALQRGQLTLALAEFQKAAAIDPASAIASQEAQRTLDLLAKEKAAEASQSTGVAPPEETGLMSHPPELEPLSREPINMKMTNDARIVYETVGELAGLSVIFDPDFVSRRITVNLPNVTLEQALDAVSLESKAFWKPVTSNIILVAPDNPQKRRELEDEEVQTFYLRNTLQPQDLTEIVNGLRQLLDIRRIQQVNAQNAIVIRATPAELVLAGKIIQDIDKAKPEVEIQVDVLEARVDRLRNLGITPGQSASLTFTPRSILQPNSSTSSSSTTTGTTTTPTAPIVTLQNLHHLSSADYSLALPGATLAALLTDSTTRIIQNPTVRVTDGSTAKLAIGDRVPVATGSFQAGVGVGVSGGAGVINPLVNTQFQYIDVGVNLDVTPRVHPDGDVSLKLAVNVSSVTGQATIGGIQQPIISQRKSENDIRLHDGETSILGGLITRSETKSLNGWPGVAHIPFLRYFFSQEDKEYEDDEVLIALTPHIVRLPNITADDLRTLAAGTDTDVRVYRASNELTPNPPAAPPHPAPAASATVPSANNPTAAAAAPAEIRFDPATVALKSGGIATIGLALVNVHDLFSIPLVLQFDPKVIQIVDIRNGGFLSGGTQEIAIVQQVDQQHGQAVVSATRRPNTPGISGSGTLLGIVVRAVAPGTTALRIVQVNARNPQQKPIPLVSGAATIQVQ